FFQAEDGIRDKLVTGVQTCALPISRLLGLYRPDQYAQTEISFRTFGPLRRFDHQRPGADDQPREDPDRGVWYGGYTLSACLVERSEERRVGKECRHRWWT